MQEEMERLKHKHQQTIAEQARQQHEIHQLTVENGRLKQQLAQEEVKHRDESACLQRKRSELELENSQLRQSHQATLERLKVASTTSYMYLSQLH